MPVSPSTCWNSCPEPKLYAVDLIPIEKESLRAGGFGPGRCPLYLEAQVGVARPESGIVAG